MLKKGARFETFVLHIDSVHKCINRIKQDIISETSLKGVHTLWIYELLKSPNGLTSAQLALKSNIDRSLVSREVHFLIESGYITLAQGAKKRGYNTRLQLTESGKEIAERIVKSALAVQLAVGSDISDGDLEVFYRVLAQLGANLEELCERGCSKELQLPTKADASD